MADQTRRLFHGDPKVAGAGNAVELMDIVWSHTNFEQLLEEKLQYFGIVIIYRQTLKRKLMISPFFTS